MDAESERVRYELERQIDQRIGSAAVACRVRIADAFTQPSELGQDTSGRLMATSSVERKIEFRVTCNL